MVATMPEFPGSLVPTKPDMAAVAVLAEEGLVDLRAAWPGAKIPVPILDLSGHGPDGRSVQLSEIEVAEPLDPLLRVVAGEACRQALAELGVTSPVGLFFWGAPDPHAGRLPVIRVSPLPGGRLAVASGSRARLVGFASSTGVRPPSIFVRVPHPTEPGPRLMQSSEILSICREEAYHLYRETICGRVGAADSREESAGEAFGAGASREAADAIAESRSDPSR